MFQPSHEVQVCFSTFSETCWPGIGRFDWWLFSYWSVLLLFWNGIVLLMNFKHFFLFSCLARLYVSLCKVLDVGAFVVRIFRRESFCCKFRKLVHYQNWFRIYFCNWSRFLHTYRRWKQVFVIRVYVFYAVTFRFYYDVFK